MARKKVGVLISGRGSNLGALLAATSDPAYPAEIVLVISNQAGAPGLDHARRAGVAVRVVDHRDFPARQAFETAMTAELDSLGVELICMAGFMRILTGTFVNHFSGRVLNIHPSLLPKFPGLDTHQRAIDAGEECHGSTVHFVTEELDGGPAIIQGRVPVMPDDSATELAARVLAVEHRIYPEAARLLVAARIECRDGAVWLDGERLLEPLQYQGQSPALTPR